MTPASQRPTPSFCIPILLLAMAPAALSAQVVPFGLDKKEGSQMVVSFGLTPEARYQFAEGGLRGNVTIIRRISYRADGYGLPLGPLQSPGRSWTNVQLRLSYCDITKLTTTFSTNSATGQTLLFNGKVTWPDQPNTTQLPKPFEAALSFPLTSPYVAVPQQDLLLDYTFRGGALKNKATWTQLNAKPYFLDAGVPSDVLFGQSTPTVVGNRSCKDPGAFFGPTGLDALVAAYRAQSGNPATDNQFVLTMQSSSTAPLATVLHAIGLTGSTTGIPVGACNRLHITPALVLPFLADGSGHAAWRASATYQPQLAGLPVWFQAAWSDSKTKALSLTNAVWFSLPKQPPVEQRRFLSAFSATALTSVSPPSARAQDLPVILYSAK